MGAYAQTITYQVDKEYAKIWINQDGTIDLQYNIRITCLSGSIGVFFTLSGSAPGGRTIRTLRSRTCASSTQLAVNFKP